MHDARLSILRALTHLLRLGHSAAVFSRLFVGFCFIFLSPFHCLLPPLFTCECNERSEHADAGVGTGTSDFAKRKILATNDQRGLGWHRGECEGPDTSCTFSLSLSLCPWRTKEEGGMTQQREISRTLQVSTATMVALHPYSQVLFLLPFSSRKR